MNVAIEISDTTRLDISTEMSKMLADEIILYIKTKNAQWNIDGADFYEKHKFFEAQFGQLDGIFDSVAERIRTIGHYAPGTLKAYLGMMHINEATRAVNESQELFRELLKDHESIIMHLRETIRSFGTEHQYLSVNDFIAGLVETHEEMSWFLRSHGVI